MPRWIPIYFQVKSKILTLISRDILPGSLLPLRPYLLILNVLFTLLHLHWPFHSSRTWLTCSLCIVFLTPRTLFPQTSAQPPPSLPSSLYLKVFWMKHIHLLDPPHLFLCIKFTTREVRNISVLHLIISLSVEWKFLKCRNFLFFPPRTAVLRTKNND